MVPALCSLSFRHDTRQPAHLVRGVGTHQIAAHRFGLVLTLLSFHSHLPDKTKEALLPAPKPVQPPLHPALAAAHHAMPGLLSAHGAYLGPGGAASGALAAAMMLQRANEEERWLARQRKLRQEKEDRQYQVSEFRQQLLEQHLDLGRPGEGADPRAEGHR